GLQPADYLITFTASTNQGTIEEYYDNVATYDLATLVTIPTTGPDPTTINATLGDGGSVSGRVTAVDGRDVDGVCVQALVPDYFSRHQQCAPEGTGPTFDYQLTGLPHGDYQIRFESPSHLNLVSEY